MKSKQSNLKRVQSLCLGAIIASMYVALTYISMAVGLDKNAIQVRFSEMLVPLAFITPSAIPGLGVGCMLANILTGCAPLDIVLGTFATIVGACGAYLLGLMKNKRAARWLCTLPNILINTVTITAVCYFCYTAPAAQNASIIPIYAFSALIGEIISCGIFGSVLLSGCEKTLRRLI